MKKKVQAPIVLKRQKVFFWLGGFVGGLIILTVSCYHFAYWHKIYPGVTVAGQRMGNQTLTQATEKIKSLTANLQPSLEL